MNGIASSSMPASSGVRPALRSATTIRWFGIRRAVPIVGDAAEIELEKPENLVEFPVDPDSPVGPPPGSVRFNGSPAHVRELDVLLEAREFVRRAWEDVAGRTG